nr:hypothetical protein CFP56_28504 [Quercus suber]
MHIARWGQPTRMNGDICSFIRLDKVKAGKVTACAVTPVFHGFRARPVGTLRYVEELVTIQRYYWLAKMEGWRKLSTSSPRFQIEVQCSGYTASLSKQDSYTFKSVVVRGASALSPIKAGAPFHPIYSRS